MFNQRVPGVKTPEEIKRSWKPQRPKEEYGVREYDKTLFLSAYFGLYGLDQIYLGNKARGFIKLFTAGGLGVMWLADFFKILDGKMLDNHQKHLLYERSITYYDNSLSGRVAIILGMVCYLPVAWIIILAT